MCQRVYSLSSQLQFVSSGRFQEPFSTAAKKKCGGSSFASWEKHKSSESKSYIFYTYSIISGKAKAQKKPTSAECNTKITFGNSFSLQQPLRSQRSNNFNSLCKVNLPHNNLTIPKWWLVSEASEATRGHLEYQIQMSITGLQQPLRSQRSSNFNWPNQHLPNCILNLLQNNLTIPK